MIRVTALLVTLGLLAGCGGGESARQRYVAALDAMCADFLAREKRIGEPQSIPELAEKGRSIQAAFDFAIASKIEVLKAPAEIAADARRLVELAHEQSAGLAALARAAQQRDRRAVLQLSSRNGQLNAEAGAITRKLGAKHCSGG